MAITFWKDQPGLDDFTISSFTALQKMQSRFVCNKNALGRIGMYREIVRERSRVRSIAIALWDKLLYSLVR